MEWLRIEFGGEALDTLVMDADARGSAEHPSNFEVFQVAFGHFRRLLNFVAQPSSLKFRSANAVSLSPTDFYEPGDLVGSIPAGRTNQSEGCSDAAFCLLCGLPLG